MSRDHIAAQLAVISAEAKAAEYDIRQGGQFRGELSQKLATIRAALEKCEQLGRKYESRLSR